MKDLKEKPKKEFDENLLEVRRVTRVTTGGRRMTFRATILVGNKKGKIGLGVAKGPDVAVAVQKASREAYKNIFLVPVTDSQSVPYMVTHKYKSALVKLIPAAPGTGLKAWSAVRAVLELAGYNNMLSKIVGTNNKLNNALATIQALSSYKVDRAALKKKLEKVEAEETTALPVVQKTVVTTKQAPAKEAVKKEVKKSDENTAAPAKKPATKKTA